MSELRNRDETEEDLLIALLALFARHEVHDDEAEEDLRNLLLYWLGLIFIRSAVQHGLDESRAETGAASWVLGHVVRVTTQMRRYSRELLDAGESVFTRQHAERVAATEVSEAASAGAEFSARLLGFKSEDDTWFTRLDERVCPYCGPLHGQPRSRWFRIYNQQILPAHPEFAVYGRPERPPAHVHCRCFIVYLSGAGDDDSN